MRPPNQYQRALLAQWRNTPIGRANRGLVDPRRIGRICAQRRTELGLSQEKLAESMGLRRNHIGRFEHGAAEPTLTTIERFCTALGIHIQDLFEVSDD